ncbi:hypothetical protein ACEPPN_016557 [Leptodophora sp. 'Broadleaf-Isolate-01']
MATLVRSEIGERDELQETDLPSNECQVQQTTLPPSSCDIDRWRYHIGLKQFGEALGAAAKAVFPNTSKSRYTRVSVLMIQWEDEDPRLPVSIEIEKLYDVFTKIYHFETEIWKIPDQGSHASTNRKILDFIENDSKDHLRIIYYAGHGELTKNRLLSWTSWRPTNSKRPTVKWSGIQNVLEEAQSDVLILLDCCASGVSNPGTGEGVTELISACSYNSVANGVGQYSFTNALTIELRDLSVKPFFTVGELFGHIFCRIQTRMPEDGHERQPAPIHLSLINSLEQPRSICLAKLDTVYSPSKVHSDMPRVHPVDHVETLPTNEFNHERGSSMSTHKQSLKPEFENVAEAVSDNKVPKLAFAIRLKEDLKVGQLSHDLFMEWLRRVPVVAEEVKIEAGFDSFSSLLILSIPISLMAYLPSNSALISLGPITSSNNVLNRTLGEFGGSNDSNRCTPKTENEKQSVFKAGFSSPTSQLSSDEKTIPDWQHSRAEGFKSPIDDIQNSSSIKSARHRTFAKASLDSSLSKDESVSFQISKPTNEILARVPTEGLDYQACHRFFLDNGQHSPAVKSIACYINILLPCQKRPYPVQSSSAAGSLDQGVPAAVSLIPYIKRLICTGKDCSEILQSFFGKSWRLGIGFIVDNERRNYLFFCKSSNWAKVKACYDLPDGQDAPFLETLQVVQESELQSAEEVWSAWMDHQDWMLGPRAPLMPYSPRKATVKGEELKSKWERRSSYEETEPFNVQMPLLDDVFF